MRLFYNHILAFLILSQQKKKKKKKEWEDGGRSGWISGVGVHTPSVSIAASIACTQQEIYKEVRAL
jgi:hypothetical protein